MKPYADSNFLIRFYLSLENSEAALTLADELRETTSILPILWLHRLEVTNAFQMHVFAWKTMRQTRVTLEMAAAALESFRDDCMAPSSLLRNTVVDQVELEKQFEELSLRHTANHGFRTYDVLHVSTALVLNCTQFWSFDAKALKLAKLEGLTIAPGPNPRC
jgi:predicted nucleic acid-binding protein